MNRILMVLDRILISLDEENEPYCWYLSVDYHPQDKIEDFDNDLNRLDVLSLPVFHESFEV